MTYSIPLLAAGAAPYLTWKLLHDLHMLQLSSYRPERHARWLRRNPCDGLHAKELYSLLALPAFALGRPLLGAALFAFFALMLYAGRPDRPQKKPLVLTARARRALAVAWALVLGLVGVGACVGGALGAALALAAATAGSGLVMLAASALVLPLENAFHARFFRAARDKVAGMPRLTVIGITGSFGKTSTKGFLQALLGEEHNSLMSPASFNTPMGIAKVVQDALKPSHRFFIAEMGAREPGNIAELCRLVGPKVGIVTAIGEQHLETFKTLDAIRRTKWELPSALPADGLAVLNTDDPNIRAMLAATPPRARVVTFGLEEGAQVRAVDVRVGPDGSSFSLVRPGRAPLDVHTRLLGRHNVANVTGAVAAAMELGVSDEALRVALRRLAAPEHRLEIRRIPGRYIMLDDAYNSNPAGAAAALDILRQMPGCRRFLVTPGMVELGSREAELNRAFGRQAAACCDLAVLVGPRQTLPIQEGLREAGFPGANLRVVDDLNAAFAVLAREARPEDVVLFENDLPENYRG